MKEKKIISLIQKLKNNSQVVGYLLLFQADLANLEDAMDISLKEKN